MRFTVWKAVVIVLLLGHLAWAADKQDDRSTYEDFAVDAEGNLIRIDCEKLVYRKAGRILAKAKDGTVVRPVFYDIAATPDGYLFGVSGVYLFKINIDNPAQSLIVGQHGLTGPYGMGPGPKGILLINTVDGQTYSIDPKTAKTKRFGPMKGGFRASGDIAILKGKVFSSVKDSAGGETFVEVNVSDGSVRKIGRFRLETGGAVPNVFGLIVRKGVLYGLTAQGAILRINPKTGSCKTLLETSVGWWGATDYLRI